MDKLVAFGLNIATVIIIAQHWAIRGICIAEGDALQSGRRRRRHRANVLADALDAHSQSLDEKIFAIRRALLGGRDALTAV